MSFRSIQCTTRPKLASIAQTLDGSANSHLSLFHRCLRRFSMHIPLRPANLI